MRLSAGLNFFSSSLSGVFFEFFCVVYRLGVMPSPRDSVHSRVTMRRIPFFLAMAVTSRVAVRGYRGGGWGGGGG